MADSDHLRKLVVQKFHGTHDVCIQHFFSQESFFKLLNSFEMSALFQFLAHRLVRQLLKCTIELLLPCFVGDGLLVAIDDSESQVKHVNIRINRKDIGCFTFEIKENDNSHSYSSPVYC